MDFSLGRFAPRPRENARDRGPPATVARTCFLGPRLFTRADNAHRPTETVRAWPAASESASIASSVMTGHHPITPAHRSIRKYYENVGALRAQGVLNEMSVRSPFESLLQETARLKDWTFIAELSGKSGGAIIRPDGTLRDRNSLPRG